MAKNKQAQHMATPRKKNDPYYPTDYSVGRREKPVAKSVKPFSPILSAGKWASIIIFGLMPLFNFIPLIAWMNKKNTKVGENQRNFAKAAAILSLIFWVIVIIAAVLIVFVFKLVDLGELLGG